MGVDPSKRDSEWNESWTGDSECAGLGSTEVWLPSRLPVTSEPGLLLGTGRGSGQNPHNRGIIHLAGIVTIPQGLVESDPAACAPAGM